MIGSEATPRLPEQQRMTAAMVDTSPNLAQGVSGKRSRRMLEIVALITERGSISLSELSDALSVSPATMRRDLADLEYQRLILRTHGGATRVESLAELPVSLRDSQFQDAKRAIAEATASLVPIEHYAVALSGGSTAATVARALSNHSDLTIVTNSLSIAALVTSFPRLKVIMTGGLLRSQSLELVGVLAENTFNAINVGTAILGTDGISAAGGVTTHDETEARTNNAMVTHAQRTIVVADGSKIGRIALAKVADIQQMDLLITDDSADPDELDRMRALGAEVLVVTARISR
jgi:DeoR family transcriptional regulator of aga operon